MAFILYVKQISHIIASGSRSIGELSKHMMREEQIILMDVPGRPDLARVCIAITTRLFSRQGCACSHTGALYGLRYGLGR
jgi:hypothetical protein